MKRNGNQIVLTEPEIAEFAQSSPLSIEAALATAFVFESVAAGLAGRAVHDLASSNPQMRQRGMDRSVRAVRLARFAYSIFNLCPGEHLVIIANNRTE